MSVISTTFATRHKIKTTSLRNAILVQLADANVEVVIKQYAIIDVVLNLLHGPVKLLKLQVGVADIDLEEVIIGRPALAFLKALPEYHIPVGTFYLDKVPLLLNEDTLVSKVSMIGNHVKMDLEMPMVDLTTLPPPVEFEDPDDPPTKVKDVVFSDELQKKIKSAERYLDEHFDWKLNVGSIQNKDELLIEMKKHVKKFLNFKNVGLI